MTSLWYGVALVAAGCYAFKIAGLSVPERFLDHGATKRAIDLIPVALLGALIAVQVFASGKHLTFDARALALAVAALMLSLRVSFLPVVVSAAVVAALIRLV